MNIHITLKSISNIGQEVETSGSMKLHHALNMLRDMSKIMRFTAIITTSKGRIITINNWYVISTGKFSMMIDL